MNACFKRLDELAPSRLGHRLEDRVFKEVLNEPENTDLLDKLKVIHTDFIAEKGLFADLFGEFLQETEKLNARAGQFFTPINVCDLMIKMNLATQDLGKQKRILDPAAGSGRFMLRTAKFYAEATGKLNFVFINVDIDFRMFVFCALNAILNEIPAVIIHGDSLAFKFWKGIVVLPMGDRVVWMELDGEQAMQVFLNRG